MCENNLNKDLVKDDKGVDEKLYALFLHCSHALSRGHHHGHGMHPSQGRILSILAKSGEMAQKDLLDMLKIRPASLSELLGKLEAKGFITRTKEENKRVVRVDLTDLGEAAIDEVVNGQKDRSKELFAALSVEKKQELVESLETLLLAWREKCHGKMRGHDMHHAHGHHMHGQKHEGCCGGHGHGHHAHKEV